MDIAVFEALVKTENPTAKGTSKTNLALLTFEILKKTGGPWDKFTKNDLNKKNAKYFYVY